MLGKSQGAIKIPPAEWPGIGERGKRKAPALMGWGFILGTMKGWKPLPDWI